MAFEILNTLPTKRIDRGGEKKKKKKGNNGREELNLVRELNPIILIKELHFQIYINGRPSETGIKQCTSTGRYMIK